MNDKYLRLEQHLPVVLNNATDTHSKPVQNNAIEQLSKSSGLTRQQIKQAMSKGAVWLTHNQSTRRLRRAKKPLHNGDILHLYYDERILTKQPPSATLIADEQAYSLWYKPYGMYCQGSKWADHCTINRWVEQQTQRPAFIVHRLDRAATGLIIIAHEKKCAAALAALFAQRRIIKYYRAVVHGRMTLSPAPVTMCNDIDGRQAISHITAIDYFEQRDQTLVQVQIETGRKHQIRRHLAQMGHPIVGERLYSDNNDATDLQLCCWQLSFTCPLQNRKKHFDLQGSGLSVF